MIGIYKLLFQTLHESLKNSPFLQSAESQQWAVFTGNRDLSICCLNIKRLNVPSRKLSALQKSQISNVSFWHKSRSMFLFINRLSKAPISTKRKACLGALGGRWCQLALGRVVVMNTCKFVCVYVCVYSRSNVYSYSCVWFHMLVWLCVCVGQRLTSDLRWFL